MANNPGNIDKLIKADDIEAVLRRGEQFAKEWEVLHKGVMHIPSFYADMLKDAAILAFDKVLCMAAAASPTHIIYYHYKRRIEVILQPLVKKEKGKRV